MLNWIDLVEKNSIGDQMRLYMFQLTAEKTVLRLLNLSSECTKWSDNITWSDIKKKLMHLIPKNDIHQTTRNLVKIGMREDDQIRVFSAKIITKYSEACNLYEVAALPMSLNHVIACTVTANMNPTGKALYWDDLRKDAEATIIEMEKSLRNIGFKKSLFKHTNMRSKRCDQNLPNVYRIGRSSLNHNHYRSYRSVKCWFFQKGTCKFGNSCRYEHN